jgi:predicted transcriptional regulator
MVKIKLISDVTEELAKNRDRIRKIFAGEVVHKDKGKILVMTPEKFASVFSPQRLRLLRLLRKTKVRSIQELAGLLDSPYESVHRNVRYLEGLGLVETNIKNNLRVPSVPENINVPLLA